MPWEIGKIGRRSQQGSVNTGWMEKQSDESNSGSRITSLDEFDLGL